MLKNCPSFIRRKLLTFIYKTIFIYFLYFFNENDLKICFFYTKNKIMESKSLSVIINFNK